MAMLKKPYEISVWNEKLGENGNKIEEKGAIIGAHDMSYLGRTINPVLRKYLNGTNILTFDMVDRYFDSLKGDYVRNDFIDELFSERKIKLFYDNEWFEFFIKKVGERKVLKSYVKTYTCTDCFIDELSRNGYGITFDEELNNSVDETGNFTEEVLDKSLWHYHPEYNWGDFTEFKEDRLFKVPVSQFGGTINGYRIWFELTNTQLDYLDIKEITNIYTNDCRPIEIGDDAARGMFWDQQNLIDPNEEKENELRSHLVNNIPNDGYIYIPYSCLNFCYGSEYSPDEVIKYDRAATETALTVDGKLVIAPDSVDPRTIIQFIAVPKGQQIEVDESGLILSKEYQYFMTLRQWNEMIQNKMWYFFEDTRLVSAEELGYTDLTKAQISHTYRYLYKEKDDPILNTYKESYGNKVAFYDGYLSDINDISLIKGKKISIADRTEINISDEINSYVNVYNNSPDEYKIGDEDLYSSEDWDYEIGDNKYRVCSKLATRQIIPQLARNLVQNGTNIKSVNGWAPMHYLESSESENKIQSAQIDLRTTGSISEEEKDISGSVLYYSPPYHQLAYIWQKKDDENNKRYSIGTKFYTMDKVDGIVRLTYNADEQNDIRKNYNNTGNIYNVYPITITESGIQKSVIKWIIKEDEEITYQEELEDKDFSIVNFGIVGQEKTIEKDKIYCLGCSLATHYSNDFNIYIGRGSLTSIGTYNLTEDYIKIDNKMLFENESIVLYNESVWATAQKNDNQLGVDVKSWKQNYILFRAPKTIENPYFVIESKNDMLICSIELFEAYTRGADSFDDAPYYRYSGRDLFGNEQPADHLSQPWKVAPETENELSFEYSYPFIKSEQTDDNIRLRIIFEDMIMLGSTYGYQQYFIQRLKTLPPSADSEPEYYDTCGAKSFLSSDFDDFEEGQLPLDASKYSKDNYVIETNYINMNKCKYYVANTNAQTCDCGYGSLSSPNKTCYYQKFGYCPYRFKTEKHCRKIRTLKVEKSNKFNIIQEISKVFQCYPQFYIQHKANGKIYKDSDNTYEKIVFYITEKGRENKVGFRYEKNLTNISRDITSEQIVSKLYVQDVDSEISKTGLCSIKTAEDNVSKDSFIIDFSYYIAKGMLDNDEVEQDLYGVQDSDSKIPQGFLRQLGYYNGEYDKIGNKIINLQDSSFTELEGNLTVNLAGITTSQEQLLKILKDLEKIEVIAKDSASEIQSYTNNKNKYQKQEAILRQLVSDTFFTEGMAETNSIYYNEEKYGVKYPDNITAFSDPIEWFKCIVDYDKMKETWVSQHLYTKGILGQYNKEYNQIQAWKKERASYLKMINKISAAFYNKYEPYLKEGTWTDSNYLTDNAYYFGALEVAAEGAIPKVSYSMSVIGLEMFDDVYELGLADTTWVEDIGMFGYNKKTGLPNRLKTLCSEVAYNLDDNSKNEYKIQNFTTQFSDLFQQITASVQSLTYNENIYKRSSNFTSLQNIEQKSLQGTLDSNSLTLLNTDEQNIRIDKTGTSGSDINNHANKYKSDGQGIHFSNDGGQHWSVGVGPDGINADFIKVGNLDATKIRIVDGNYVYFGWDKGGIISYRDPYDANTTTTNKNDFTCFNRFGLSLVENGRIKLRSGYSFNGSADGRVDTEKTPGSNIGFYLYNANGQEIFSTTAASEFSTDQSKNTGTARIKLIGEMFVSDSFDDAEKISQTYYKYNYGVLISEGNAYEGGNKGSITIDDADNYLKINDDGIKIYDSQHDNEINDNFDIYQNSLTKNYIGWPRNISFITGATATGFNSVSIILQPYIKMENDSHAQGAESSIPLMNLFSDGAKYHEYIRTPSSIQGISTNNLYLASDNRYYIHQYTATKEVDGAAGVFINNKTAFGNGQIIEDKKRRLFCITRVDKQENNASKISNIFTVLKDGSLYIGGNIPGDPGSLSNLPDIINNVSDYKIKLTTEGRLEINFDEVIDTGNNNISLKNYILTTAGSAGQGAVGAMRGHYHPLETTERIKIKAIEGEYGLSTLRDKINEIVQKLYDNYLLTGTWTYGWSGEYR